MNDDRTDTLWLRACADRGVVAVWTALLLSVFMGFAAMAVDIGNWYVTRSRVQSATDAAALGGAALLPDDPQTAVDTAIQVAEQHGFSEEEVEVRVEQNSQLVVTIHGHYDNIFLPSLGFDDTKNIAASARAEFEGSVAMGNPDADLGIDPERVGVAGYISPGLYVGIAGPNREKTNGDRYSSFVCGSAITGCGTGSNTEFEEEGYFYEIEVTDTNTDDLVIEVFDPVFVNVSSTCSWQNSNYGLPTSTQRTNLYNLTNAAAYTSGGNSIPQGWYDDVATRFASGDGDWCTGDQGNGVARVSGVTHRLATNFIVRSPDATPWNEYDNPIVSTTTCAPQSFTAYDTNNANSWQDGDVYDLLHPTSGPANTEWVVNPTDGVWTFAETFRRWVEVCRIPNADLVEGTYLLQVRTSAGPSNPTVYDSGWYADGLNIFSLRAGFDTGGAVPDPLGDVTIAAAGKLPIYANLPSGTSTFYLARVLPTSRSRTLTIELFDAGDVSGGTVSIQVLPPADTGAPTSFSGCVMSTDASTTMSVNAGTCTINSVGSSYNGAAILIQVPIPTTYTCSSGSADGCWVRLRMNFTGDAHDFTTWTAFISGDPVRLID